MRILIAAALLAAAPPVNAQQAPAAVSDEAGILAEQALEKLKAGNVEQAVEGAFAGVSAIGVQQAQKDQLVAQIKLALGAYGPLQRWEKVETETRGTLVRQDTFLVQHRDFVTRWRFTYMRVLSGWRIVYFGFEDKVSTWFE